MCWEGLLLVDPVIMLVTNAIELSKKKKKCLTNGFWFIVNVIAGLFCD
jgi:hypothetical protein